MERPFVIIGGDAAGMSAASKIKRSAKNSEVIVFERDKHISYAACGMPYWLGGLISSAEKLKALPLKAAREKRGIDVRILHEVTEIDPKKKLVVVKDLESGKTFEQPYEKLMIATGASAVKPNIPGADLPGVFTLRSLSDGEKIREYLESKKLESAVIVGAGYVGLEMAEAFHTLAMDVTVVELAPRPLPNADPEMSEKVRELLLSNGVSLRLEKRVEKISKEGDKLFVTLDDKEEIDCDIVILSVGIKPNSELAEKAGLKLGERGAIAVDRTLQTSDPDIFSAGDCAEHYHRLLKKNVWFPLAPSANKAGRLVGENMLGAGKEFDGILGTSIVKIFDRAHASTGLTLEEAQKYSDLFGEVASVTISAEDRAGYYPGGDKIFVKLVFQTEGGKLLGGQLFGKVDAVKRIDTLVALISAGMTVRDLSQLDLAYAPPFSPVYDPLIVAANVALKKVKK